MSDLPLWLEYDMRVFRSLFFSLCALAMLAGCDPRAAFDRFVPKQEAAFAKQLVSELVAKDYDAVESSVDSSLKSTSLRHTLEQVVAVFPSGQPESVKVVGANTSTINGVTTYDLTLEYGYARAWLLTEVVLQRHGGQLAVMGLHVTPIKQPLEVVNQFTFRGKSLLHYIVFALMVLILLVIVYALVRCFQTPMAKRKWLWLLFIVCGFVQFSLNWTDGAFSIQPITLRLLGVGYFHAGPYAPVILQISIPIGAIVFLMRRRSMVGKHEGRPDQEAEAQQ